MSWDAIVAWLLVKKFQIIGGAIGAAISIKLINDLKGWTERATTYGCGLGIAITLSGPSLRLLDMAPDEDSLIAAGALLGMFGYVMAANFMKAIPEWFANIKAYVFSRLPQGKNGDQKGDK